MINQINIYGRTKVEQAIHRLQKYEPPEGYTLAFSGGKDSVTIKALADLAGVKYKAEYRVTSIDPPELVQFVKTHKDVTIALPHYKDGTVVTAWNLIPKKKTPPTRIARYCCEYLKESNNAGRFMITGVRWAESSKRQQNRAGLEVSEVKTGRHTKLDADTADPAITQGKTIRILNPIIDWTDADVWEFIKSRGVAYCSLYDEGFKRLGCVGCPNASNQKQELDRWPKIKEAYLRAFDRMIQARKDAGLTTRGDWDTAQGVMDWWVNQ